MKQVASLRYGVIFKKAFCDVDIFNAFVRDILGIEFQCDSVETEKEFDTLIGKVKPRFDLYAEDKTNRIIVDIQHRRDSDHYDRFLHYHCAALLEQIKNSTDYRPKLAVYTIVVLTSGDKHKSPLSIIDFDPKTMKGESLGEIPHKVIYLCPKYINDDVPSLYREWLQVIDDSLDSSIDETLYHNPQIQKIVSRIETDNITPEERYWMIEEYSEEKAKLEMRESALKKGKLEGQLEEKKTIAKNLLLLGLDYSAIAQATGLTSAEIEGLSN
jgi:predicted transposase/invertase (TIGR01784 family)